MKDTKRFCFNSFLGVGLLVLSLIPSAFGYQWCKSLNLLIKLKSSKLDDISSIKIQNEMEALFVSSFLENVARLRVEKGSELEISPLLDLNEKNKLSFIWSNYFKYFERKWLGGVSPQSSFVKGIGGTEKKVITFLEFKEGNMVLSDVDSTQWNLIKLNQQPFNLIITAEGKPDTIQQLSNPNAPVKYSFQVHAAIKELLEEANPESIIESLSSEKKNYFAGSMIVKPGSLEYNPITKIVTLINPHIIKVTHHSMRGLVSSQQFLYLLAFLKQSLRPSQKRPFEMTLSIKDTKFNSNFEAEIFKKIGGKIIIQGVF